MIYELPERLEAELVSRIPASLRRDHPGWGVPHLGSAFDCYIEGLAFDPAGDLHVVDIPSSRVLKLDGRQQWSIVAEYDGRPKGLAFRPDGRMLISDNRFGLVHIDPAIGRVEIALDRSRHGHFQACNDLHLSESGDVVFTDQAASSLSEPNGCIFLWRSDGTVDRLVSNAPGPNGITFNLDRTKIFVSIVRSNAIWSIELDAQGRHLKTGHFIQLSGGIGPDGLALDAEGGLVVAHLGTGTVWRFDRRGLPTHVIPIQGGTLTSSVAFGGTDRRDLFISEGTGAIYKVRMPFPGPERPPGTTQLRSTSPVGPSIC